MAAIMRGDDSGLANEKFGAPDSGMGPAPRAFDQSDALKLGANSLRTGANIPTGLSGLLTAPAGAMQTTAQAGAADELGRLRQQQASKAKVEAAILDQQNNAL